MAIANSAAYSLTYSGESVPIETTGTDSIGQHCAVMKARGSDAGGNMHFAVRDTGPYGASDGVIVRAGTGAVYSVSVTNLLRQYVLVEDLESSKAYYWAAAFDTGAATTTGQFTTKSEPAQEAGVLQEGIQS